ncbi:hypothetical protein YYY_05120 [Anaplasma phagocytophilum str. Dog2]|nr:hypothetical protein YYY_05120 [Anaplasma phagocytophilum str. Dog2]
MQDTMTAYQDHRIGGAVAGFKAFMSGTIGIPSTK